MRFVELSDVSPRQKEAFAKMDEAWLDQAAEMCRLGWFWGHAGVLARARQHCKNSQTLGGRGILAFVYLEFSKYCRAKAAMGGPNMLAGVYWFFTALLYDTFAAYHSWRVVKKLGGVKKLSVVQLLLRARILLAHQDYRTAGWCAWEGLRHRGQITLSQSILLKCVLAECLVFYKEEERAVSLYRKLGELAAGHHELEPQILVELYRALARRTVQLHRGGFREEESREEARALFQRAIKIAVEKKWDATAIALEAEAERLCQKQC